MPKQQPKAPRLLAKSLYLAESFWFAVVAAALYSCMGLALWLAYIPWWLAMPGTMLLAIDCNKIINLHGWRRHKQSVLVLYQDCDKWQYALNSGQTCLGTLIRKKSFCSSLVIILYIQHLYSGRYIIVPRDALSEHNYRYLALNLSCQGYRSESS